MSFLEIAALFLTPILLLIVGSEIKLIPPVATIYRNSKLSLPDKLFSPFRKIVPLKRKCQLLLVMEKNGSVFL